MSLLSLKLPPGVVNNGAESESAGRYRITNQVRWIDSILRPWGGSRARSSAAAVTGKARAVLPWRDNSGDRWIAIGTNSKLYAQKQDGTNYDITPSGFTAGLADAAYNTGYGGGLYGAGTYGTPRASTGSVTSAGLWTLDVFGQNLIGCMGDSDGKIYQWALATGTPAAVVTNAPTGCASCFTSPEGHLVALKNRTVLWSDQEAATTWTATATNQAGDQNLQTTGSLICGRGMKGQSLVLTSTDAWSMVYRGQPYIYGFTRVGQGCGAISKGALVVTDTLAAWMGAEGFFGFDGFVSPIPCDVTDYVFKDINRAQVSKVVGIHYAAAAEVRWHYPSGASVEVDRYVAFNYRDNHWSVGTIDRIGGCDKGPYDYPMMTSADGYLYEHEVGLNSTWYAETGPFRLGRGDRMLQVNRIVPDEGTQGDVTVTIYTKTWPNGSETTRGPYTMADPTDALFQAAQMRIRYTGNTLADARIGEFRMDVVPGDYLVI